VLGARGVVSPTGADAGIVSLDGCGRARGGDGVARTNVWVPRSSVGSTGKIGLDADKRLVGEDATGATTKG
jgi:hypothetical protein